MDKLMIFIDGNNLFRGADEEKVRIDYPKLISLISNDILKESKLIRVYFYVGIPNKNVWDKNYETWEQFSEKLNKQTRFLDSLQFKYHFHVITRPLVLVKGERKEKGIDVNLAVDVVWHGLSNNYDICVIISGDKDLLECISRMKDCGKRVIVANFEKCISKEVIKLCDEYINLSEHKEDINFE